MSISPDFNIDSILGFNHSSIAPAAKVLYDKKEEEEKVLYDKKEEEEKVFDSWLEKGHPFGNEVDGKNVADLGLMGLLRFGGGGPFGGVLKDHVDIGCDPLSFMSDFLEMLGQKSDLLAEWGLDKKELDRLSTGLQGSKAIAKKLNKIRAAGEADLADAITAFATELKGRLESDKVVYFPVLNDEGKYSQVVRVDKDHGFSVIEVDENSTPYLVGLEEAQANLSGMGLRQDHVKQTVVDPLTGKKTETFKVQQFISFEASNKERLGDQEFFKALIKNSVISSENDREMIYQSLPKYIEGKRLKASDTESAFYRKVYRYFDKEDKNSSFQSISALIYYMSLDPFFGSDKDCSEAVKQYKKIKFLLQTQLFFAYVTKIEENETWHEVSREEKTFLNDVLSNLTRSAEKMYKSDALTKEQSEAFFVSSQHVKSILSRPELRPGTASFEDQEVLARAATLDQAHQFNNARNIESVSVPPKAGVSDFVGDLYAPSADDKAVVASPAETLMRALIEFDYDLELTEETEDKQLQVEKLTAKLNHLKEQYRRLKNNPQLSSSSRLAEISERRAVFDQFNRTLGDVVAMLPAPEKDDQGFWGQLAPEQAKQCFDIMEEFSILVQSFATLERQYKPFLPNESSRGHTPETLMMMLTLHAVQLKLASQNPDYGVEEETFSYLPFLLEMRSIRFVVEHPGLRKQVHSLLRYFNPESNVEELTRPLKMEDLIKDTKAFFSFAHQVTEEVVESFRIDLTNKIKEKSKNQLYFEKMLDVPGVREGVRVILIQKNAEIDAQHTEAMHHYERSMRNYNERIEELKGELREKNAEIDQIAPRDTLQALRDLHKTNESINYGRGRNVEESRNKRAQLISRLGSLRDPDAVAACLHQAENQRSYLQNSLDHLPKPAAPTHQGHYPLDSVVDQLSCLLFDDEGRQLIPKEMNAVVQAVLRNQYLILEDTKNFDLEDEGMRFQFNGAWRPLPLDAQDTRISIRASVKYSNLAGGNIRDVRSSISYNCPRDLTKNLRSRPRFLTDDGRSEGQLHILIQAENGRTETQNQAIVSKDQFFGLNVGLSRELRMLGIDPYDVVSRTIGFLGRNMELVKNAAVQEYLHVLLFRPERIHTQLRDNPELTSKIDGFIRATVIHYKEIHDIDTCLAMIKLGERFRQSAFEIKGNDGGFSDYREVVLSELIPNFSSNKPEDKAAQLKAYRTLVHLHAYEEAGSDLDADQTRRIVCDLLAMRVSRNLQSEGASLSQQDEALEKAALLRFQHLVEDRVTDSDLTSAVKVAVPDADLDANSQWKNDNEGNYTCEGYAINVHSGIVMNKGIPVVTTPDWIIDNEILRRVYTHSISSGTCQKENDWTYTLFPGDLNKRVTVTSLDFGRTIEIVRLIDGKSYRYVPTPENLIENMPTLFDRDVLCWINDDGEMLVYQDGRQTYKLDLASDDGFHFRFQKLTRVKDQAEKLNFSTATIMEEESLSQLFQPLAVLENDPQYIECWKSSDGKKITVDFKRLGLSFDVKPEEIGVIKKSVNFQKKLQEMQTLERHIQAANDEDQVKQFKIKKARLGIEIMELFSIHCQNFPGFSLTLPILTQSLDSKIPYITLLNGSGERKILVPKTENDTVQLSEEPLKWHEFDVVKVKSNGVTSFDITSSSVEQQLLQLMMLAQKRDFRRVKQIVDKLNPLGALTDKNVQLMKKALAILGSYNHPEATALVMKMLLIKEINSLKYPKIKAIEEQAPEEGIPDDLLEYFQEELPTIAAYELYRQSGGDAASFRLSDEDERKFVEILYTKIKLKIEKLNSSPDREGAEGSLLNRIGGKLGRWFKGRILPNLITGFLEERLGDRYRDLSRQEGKLGLKKVTLATVPRLDQLGENKGKPTPNKSDIMKAFFDLLGEEGTRLDIPGADQIDDCLNTTVKNGEFWKKNFVILYHVARSGTDDQKASLQKALDLSTHLNSGEHRIIRWVLAKPGRYATLEKVNEIIHKWRVEGPEKLQVAEDELAIKKAALEAANRDFNEKQEKYNQVEKEERDTLRGAKFYFEASNSGLFERIGKLFRYLVSLPSKSWRESFRLGERVRVLEKCKKLAEKTKSDADKHISENPNNFFVDIYRRQSSEMERTIADIERRIAIIPNYSPVYTKAKDELKVSRAAQNKSMKEAVEAKKRHAKADAYIRQMEAKLKATVTSALPGMVWKVIHNYVIPVFKSFSTIWKLYWKGNKFLHSHNYKVRDIFSSGQTSRTGTALTVNRDEVSGVDQSFNRYFKELVDKFFQVERFEENVGPVWDARDGGDPLVQAKLDAEKAALDEYRTEVRKPREHAELKTNCDLVDLLDGLKEKEQLIEVSLVRQKEVLLWQLNRAISSNEQSKLMMQLNKSGQKGDLTWDDLRALTLDGEWEAFQKKTGLDEANAKMLMKGVADYLVKATRLNQIRSVIGKVHKAQSAKTEAKRKIYYTNILEALRQERHYLQDSGANLSRKEMGRLWFEYANGYLYREQQIRTLDETGAMTDPEILMEAPTGFGKSKNYVPTRDHEMAKEHLVLNVHPRTIEQINAEDILAQMRDSFGGKADRFHFQRSSEFSVRTLKALYEELQVNFEEGRPINFSAETLQALELHFLMSLYDYKQKVDAGNFSKADKTEARQEVAYFIMILRAVSVYGWATIDESHVNLNPFTNKLIYTIGESTTLETYQVDILEEMMELMITDSEIGKRARIQDNKQAKVTSDDYAVIANQLGEHFADKYRITEPGKREEYLQFVSGELDNIPAWIKKHPQAKQIALVKGMLSMILKSSMEGYVDENYGLSKLHFDKEKEYAIAYASSNTPKENETSPSQFKNAHETMIKTYLTYLHKGLKEEQVVKMIKKMQAEQLLEAQTTGSLSNTRAGQAFSEIAGEEHALQQLKDEDMHKLFPAFQHNQNAVFYYVRNIIVPQLRLYEKTLVSTPQNLRCMFGSSLSLSATPQDPATHGPDTVMVPMKGTQGQVTHLFLKKVDSSSKIHQAAGSNPTDVLDSAIDKLVAKEQVKCLIDAGGLLRGLSNEFVAERLRGRIIESGSSIEAIQYFDVNKEKFVVMEVSTGTLSDPKVAKTDPANMVTIFDQPRCFGSDTVQDETASALLLVNNNKTGNYNTDKNKAGQGAGRMRQWHLDQGMEVMMTPEDYQSLFGKNEANIGDLLNQWVGSLGKQEAKENYQALLQQMDNELRSPAMHRMLGVKTGDKGKGQKDVIRDVVPDVDKALRLFGKFEPLLVTDDSSDPWVLYAEMPKDKKPEESLDEHLKHTKKRADKIGGFSRSQRRILSSRLGRYSKKWKAPKDGEEDKRVKLPETVKSSKVDTGTQVEVQVQAEQQVEAHVEEQRWEELTLRTPSKWSDQIKLFKPGWEKPHRKSIFFNRLANSLSKLEPKNPIARIAFRAGVVVDGTALAATAAAVAGVAWPIIVGVGSALLVAGLAFVAYKTFAGSNVKYVSNCSYKVSDVMGIQLPKRAKRAARFFSPNLTASNNYYAQHTASWRESVQKPFDQEQKPVFNVLVIQDEDKEGKKKLQMMMTDQNDSVYFRRRLQADYEQTGEADAIERKRKIAVYDVTNGTVAVEGANGFSERELEDNPEFVSLLTQAKVVNGEIHYTDEERLAIAERGQRVGVDHMTRFAEDQVLAEYPIRKLLFPNSDFKHALQTITA